MTINYEITEAQEKAGVHQFCKYRWQAPFIVFVVNPR